MTKQTLLFLLFLLVFACWACNSPSQPAAKSPAPASAAPINPDAPPANLGPDGVVDIETVDDELERRGLAEATFAGGCFWCTEAVFERVKGVAAVYSGYTGGRDVNPSYEDVGSGATDHAEAIRIYYDSAVVDYPTLLKVFFATHDPTQLNRQGPDVGAQYRSGVFYHDQRQKELTEAYIGQLRESGKYDKVIVTEVSPLGAFYKAEAYHQAYYEQPNPPNAPYVRNVTRPKVEKFVKEFPELLKEPYKR